MLKVRINLNRFVIIWYILKLGTHENPSALTFPPAMCPLCQYSCRNVIKWIQVVTPWHHKTSWHHAVTSHDVICPHHKKHAKVLFFKMATLTFDLRPWPSNLHDILSMAISALNFRSVAQAVQSLEHWQTDTQTHTQTGPIPYPRQLMREGIFFIYS